MPVGNWKELQDRLGFTDGVWVDTQEGTVPPDTDCITIGGDYTVKRIQVSGLLPGSVVRLVLNGLDRLSDTAKEDGTVDITIATGSVHTWLFHRVQLRITGNAPIAYRVS